MQPGNTVTVLLEYYHGIFTWAVWQKQAIRISPGFELLMDPYMYTSSTLLLLVIRVRHSAMAWIKNDGAITPTGIIEE